MPPGKGSENKASSRGLNGIEFMHRCYRVIECINLNLFPKVDDILIPYV